MARRSLAWATIGVIPEGTSLREVYEEYGSTQVIGYYDTLTGELKFPGTRDPSPLERIALAHELTHAIDDQRFGLDVLSAECRDEEVAAAVALVEGNATFFMLRWAQAYLTPEEQVEVGVEAALQDTSTGDIPPFVLRLQVWSYDVGLRFITALSSQGGVDAIDQALAGPPISTEQIIHPERYPNDAPTPMDVPDLSAALGEGWEDLDVITIGGSWLQVALGLRLARGPARQPGGGGEDGCGQGGGGGRGVERGGGLGRRNVSRVDGRRGGRGRALHGVGFGAGRERVRHGDDLLDRPRRRSRRGRRPGREERPGDVRLGRGDVRRAASRRRIAGSCRAAGGRLPPRNPTGYLFRTALNLTTRRRAALMMDTSSTRCILRR